MFINDAFAQTGGLAASSTGNLMVQLGLIVLIFYVLLIRPQQKQVKLHREMVKNLKKGDKIMTAGGVYAKVVDASDPVEVVVEIASGVNVTINRLTIKDIANPLPVEANAKKAISQKVEKKKPANSNKK